MDEDAPRFALPRGAIRVGLALGMLLLVRVTTLASWEAWGGVAILAAAGASSVTWRTRPDPARSERVAALAALAGIALAAGALARSTGPAPAIGILLLALLAMPTAPGPRWRLASLGMLVAALLAGSVWISWSTPARIGQTGAAFALGALIANVVVDDASWIARIVSAIVSVAIASALA